MMSYLSDSRRNPSGYAGFPWQPQATRGWGLYLLPVVVLVLDRGVGLHGSTLLPVLTVERIGSRDYVSLPSMDVPSQLVGLMRVPAGYVTRYDPKHRPFFPRSRPPRCPSPPLPARLGTHVGTNEQHTKRPGYDHFSGFFGRGVFTADGDDWRAKRASVAHAMFRRNGSRLGRDLALLANEEADALLGEVEALREAGARGEVRARVEGLLAAPKRTRGGEAGSGRPVSWRSHLLVTRV